MPGGAQAARAQLARKAGWMNLGQQHCCGRGPSALAGRVAQRSCDCDGRSGATSAVEVIAVSTPSDLTLVRGDLLAVPDAILLSRRALATIKGNLIWSFGYNAAAIPLAALGFLNPLMAAAAMAFSSVFVVTNSLRLRRFRPGFRDPRRRRLTRSAEA